MSQVKLTADSGGGTTSLKAPSSTTSNADVVLKLPVADGSANQVLKTDGSGQLSFTSNAGTTINNNADNRVITGSGTANTLNAESDVVIDANGNVGIGTTSPGEKLDIDGNIKLPDNGTVHFGVSDTAFVRGKDSTDGYVLIGTNGTEVARFDTAKTLLMNECPSLDSTAGSINITGGTSGGRIAFQGTSTSAGAGLAEVFAHWGTNKVAGMIALSGTDTTNKDDGVLTFLTSSSGPSVTERMRIDSSGRVGIGISNQDNNHLQVVGSSSHGTFMLGGSSNLVSGYRLVYSNSGNTSIEHKLLYHSTNANAQTKYTSGFHTFHTGTGGDERMRIDSSGLLKVGSTTNTDIYNTSGTGNEGAWLVPGGASQFAISNTVVCRMNRKTSNGKILAFYYNGSEVGTISTNANSLPSDRNFKTNISDLNLGLSLVKKLKPSQYNYKIDNDNTPVMYGLIAQELEESLTSEGITKNSTQLIQHHPTDNSESDYDVDYTKLVPILINSIKELATKLEALETKVAALETKVAALEAA